MEDAGGIRTGAIGAPTVGQVAALAGVFGVEPSYLLDRGEPPLDGELVEALRDREGSIYVGEHDVRAHLARAPRGLGCPEGRRKGESGSQTPENAYKASGAALVEARRRVRLNERQGE